MDNRTKYEHPDFFLFLNLYFFFRDCETRDEVNLLYVSATRAKKTLIINKLLVNILANVVENEKTAQA
ncbi:hypothetical protein [Arsenophonus sp. ENCA]|uniref:hypothetical protein n=1 Tax=Arsenophonus sp. ENCA TaxID=1987579 RepID=UPI0025C4002B|nr:hypothetical protein [Arsenophonus sp. ENCA]